MAHKLNGGTSLGGGTKLSINARACFRTLYTGTFTYSTVRSANINNKTVAIIYRLVQLGILTYIIGYDLIWNKGYQATDTVTSTVTTKVKGLGFISEKQTLMNKLNNTKMDYDRYLNLHKELTYTKLDQLRIFDTSDYIIPPNEYNSIFVMTNFIETMQTPGVCAESLKRKDARCNKDSDCTRRTQFLNTWNGIPTGKCINSTLNPKEKVCEITAWCPVEEEPAKRNILTNITNQYISTCIYQEDKDRHCPVFLVKNILESAESDATERLEMLRKGGVIQIEISWRCNYDILSERCLPKYSFRRFDLPFKNTSTASGFNFRFANKYVLNGSEYRTLYKAHGLRFFISVTGQAGKFSFLPLMLTIGAGFGLMSFSVIIADCVLLNFTHKKNLFKRLKELDAKEAYQHPEIYKTDDDL